MIGGGDMGKVGYAGPLGATGGNWDHAWLLVDE